MKDEPLRRQEREERLLKKKQKLYFHLGVLRGFTREDNLATPQRPQRKDVKLVVARFAVLFFSNLLEDRKRTPLEWNNQR